MLDCLSPTVNAFFPTTSPTTPWVVSPDRIRTECAYAVPVESQGLLWKESFIETERTPMRAARSPTGLSPLAFFVHAVAGREALVEGATSTAQSGYSMRLGVKAMESTITEYDYSVRDGKRIVQFRYVRGRAVRTAYSRR